MPLFSPEQRLAIAIGVPTLALLLFLWFRRRQTSEEYDDEDDEQVTIFETRLEVKIPQYLVGSVIGRGGENIKRIQKDTGAYLRFKDNEEEPEISDDFDDEKKTKPEKNRTVIIKGEREKAKKAELLIKNMVLDQPNVDKEEVFIPQVSVGRIIGRGGQTIRHISKVSGAKLVIDRDEVRLDIPRKCTIMGTADQIALAKGLIDEQLAEHEQIMASKPFYQSAVCQRETLNTPIRSKQVSTTADQPSFTSSVKYPDTNDFVEVFVSAVDNPGHFWVQLVRNGDAQKLDKLSSTLTDEAMYGSADDIVDSLQVGTICSALFTNDEFRYRAEVTKINNDGTVNLYYVDYGDSDVAPKYRLRKLKEEHLELPFQAIECYLANTKPIDGSWSDQSTEEFEALTYFPNWVGLMVKVVKYCGGIPCIEIFDTTTAQDLNINDEMVKRGFATKNLDYPVQSVKCAEKLEKPVHQEKLELVQPEKLEQPVHPEKLENPVQPAKPEQPEKLEQPEKPVDDIPVKPVQTVQQELIEKSEDAPSSALDEEDAGESLDLSGPISAREFSPIKSALVKRVSKDYIDTSAVRRKYDKTNAHAPSGHPVEELRPVQIPPEVEHIPEASILPEEEHLPEAAIQPEWDRPEVNESLRRLSNSYSPKKNISQVLKPEVQEMIQFEVSQAFEAELEPSTKDDVRDKGQAGVTKTVVVRDKGEVGVTYTDDVNGKGEVSVTDSGIGLEKVESTLSVTIDPTVTHDDDDDDDELETFTSSLQKQVIAKKTFVSTVTVNQNKQSTVKLVPSNEQKANEPVSHQSTTKSYAQAAGGLGFENGALLNSDFSNKSESSNEIRHRVTEQSSDGQQTSQTSFELTQALNGQGINVKLESEAGKIQRRSPDYLDSDSESYASALDEPASDTDSTSCYETAACPSSGSMTSLDDVTVGNDTDTDTLRPPREEGGTPVNSDSDDDDDDDGDKTPKRKSSEGNESDAVTPTSSSMKRAAQYLSDMDLGYRGDSEDTKESKEDLR